MKKNVTIALFAYLTFSAFLICKTSLGQALSKKVVVCNIYDSMGHIVGFGDTCQAGMTNCLPNPCGSFGN